MQLTMKKSVESPLLSRDNDLQGRSNPKPWGSGNLGFRPVPVLRQSTSSPPSVGFRCRA